MNTKKKKNTQRSLSSNLNRTRIRKYNKIKNFSKSKRYSDGDNIRPRCPTDMRDAMIEKANATFDNYPLLAFFDDENFKRLNQYCFGRFPLRSLSLYRALKLSFLWNIGGLYFDSANKSEMSQGWMGQAVGVFTPAMFNIDDQPYLDWLWHSD